MLHFVDTSNHDDTRGPIDWVAVREHTAPVMLHKACEGDPGHPSWYEDPYFTRDVNAARAAGFELTGGYHCVAAGDQASVNRQVDALLRLADTVGGYASGWWMTDVEAFAELKALGIVPRLDDVRRFEDRWHQLTEGWPLAHYIPRWMWAGWWGSAALTGLQGPLIASSYPSTAAMAWDQLWAAIGGARGWPEAYGGRTPDVWQWAATATIPGLPGRGDINAYRGTLAEFTALVTKPTEDPMKLATFVRAKGTQDVYLSIAMMVRRRITEDHLGGVAFWITQNLGLGTGEIQEVDDLDAFGVDITPGPGQASPASAAAIATQLIDQLKP